jgi:hypothetical protein
MVMALFCFATHPDQQLLLRQHAALTWNMHISGLEHVEQLDVVELCPEAALVCPDALLVAADSKSQQGCC